MVREDDFQHERLYPWKHYMGPDIFSKARDLIELR